MPPRLLAILLATALLAGCTSDGAPDTGAPTTSVTPTTGPAPAAPAPPAAPQPLSAACDITRTNLGTPVGLGLYADRAVTETGCHLDDLFDDHSWASSLLVEVTWTPGPGMTGADAWVESDACQPTPVTGCPIPQATSGTSPLTLKVEGDDFAAAAGADLQVQVAAQGAAIQQAFQVTFTLFANATVDAGFTALA